MSEKTSDQVFLKDFEDFLKDRLNLCQNKLDSINKEIAERQAKHETTFWYTFLYKKFGWKSYAKFQHSLFDEIVWDKSRQESRIETINAKLVKLVYNRKAMEVMMYQDIDVQLVDNDYGDLFYLWAKENNRPY